MGRSETVFDFKQPYLFSRCTNINDFGTKTCVAIQIIGLSLFWNILEKYKDFYRKKTLSHFAPPGGAKWDTCYFRKNEAFSHKTEIDSHHKLLLYAKLAPLKAKTTWFQCKIRLLLAKSHRKNTKIRQHFSKCKRS